MRTMRLDHAEPLIDEFGTGIEQFRRGKPRATYPMGSDKQLIQTLTGKEVPADARAAEVGVLVHNVSTCAAVHKAIRLGQGQSRGTA